MRVCNLTAEDAEDGEALERKFILSFLRDLCGETKMKTVCKLITSATAWTTLVSWTAAADAPPIDRDTPPAITREERLIEGWRVRVDRRLLEGERADVGRRAVRLLGDKLYEIAQFPAADRLEKLRAVVIVLDLDHGRLRNMQYHPSSAWLREHGYDPAMAKAVHIPQAPLFIDLRHQRVQPWCVLHELAHAYHDQVFGYDDGPIRATYEAAKAAGTYEKVRHILGHETKHYALTNPMEYFAELSEAYFGTNDFYPFVRAELQQHDPRGYELLEKIWGTLP